MADDPQPAISFLGRFTVLKGAARELWITFAVKLLVIAAYALTNSTLVLWLSSDLGYSDQNALRLVAAWSLLMTAIRRSAFWRSEEHTSELQSRQYLVC